MTKRITIELREDDFEWLRKTLPEITVPWRVPLAWKRIRARLTHALEVAAEEQS